MKLVFAWTFLVCWISTADLDDDVLLVKSQDVNPDDWDIGDDFGAHHDEMR